MFDIIKLKNNFNEIKLLRESVNNLLTSLNDKVDLLGEFYKEILDKHINETSNGLDSFHFQSKLINMEVTNNVNIFNIIDTRIYCDYYKLFKTIVKYLLENIKNKNLTGPFENKIYPIYKDLEVNQSFNFDITIELYNDIIQGCDILNNELITREHNLILQKKKRDSGLNIDNLINSIIYNNSVLKNNIDLFSNYINVFNNFHIKYFTRFFLRTKLFYGQINSDIRFEESKMNITSTLLIDNSFSLNEEDEKNIRIIIDNKCETTEKIDTNNISKELNTMIRGISNSPETVDNSNNLINDTNIEIVTKNNDKNNDKKIDKKNDKKIKITVSDGELEYNLNKNCIIV
jgi:hypothetical protein